MHGLAFNLNVDISYFNYIIPCGIADKKVTSLHLELGKEVDEEEVRKRVIKNFAEVFECEISESSI